MGSRVICVGELYHIDFFPFTLTSQTVFFFIVAAAELWEFRPLLHKNVALSSSEAERRIPTVFFSD